MRSNCFLHVKHLCELLITVNTIVLGDLFQKDYITTKKTSIILETNFSSGCCDPIRMLIKLFLFANMLKFDVKLGLTGGITCRLLLCLVNENERF